MKNKIRIVVFLVLGVWLNILLYSCANRGSGPQGGPVDETPPQVLKTNPANGVTNFQKKEIYIEFDENIQLDKVAENVIISPPQVRNPQINSYGKRLIVRFEDELQDSTTYTINFGNAIVDLNEKNPLSDYSFSFSTGDDIDTLRVSGVLINAEDLNPISGIYVGIYSEDNDSAFLTRPFERIGRTNEKGYFSIDNIKEGTYKLYALGDNNRDYYYQVGEGVAFYDSLITPTYEIVEHIDTVWSTDSLSIDTVYNHAHGRFIPDNLLLRYFKEDKVRQYFIKSERLKPEKITLYFNTASAELPVIETLNFDWEGKYILQRNNTLDTLSYWLTDSLIWNLDTLQIAMTYYRTDSIFQLYETTDTLNIPQRRIRARGRRANETTTVEPLSFKQNINSVFEIYNPVTLLIEEPLFSYDTDMIHLNQKIDTLIKPLEYTWEKMDSSNMNFAIRYDWQPNMNYQVEIDSAAFVSIYGKANKKYTANFRIRPLEEYSELKVVLTNYDPRAVIQLLDGKDNVLISKPALTEETVFEHLKPTEYYLRLFIDENGNGKWDTGDLATKRHPEEVYYYPYKLVLKANFEFTENWDHLAKPLLEQKPQSIRQDISKKK